jgi:uncharacterized membrane protein
MSLQEQNHTGADYSAALPPAKPRWIIPVIVATVLLLMLFYALTDGVYVHQDPLLAAGDWSGYALCHRITERSFTIYGRQFPLCARCTGMYLGAALTILTLFLSGRAQRVLLPRRGMFIAMLLLLAVMGIDGLNSYSHFFPDAPHLYEPRNWLRLATGMGAGLTLGVITFAALAQALWRWPRYMPLIENWRELVSLLLLGLVTAGLVLSNQQMILYVMALASSAGLIFVVAALNTAVVLVFLHSDGQSETWKEAVRPLLAGLILAVMELTAVSSVRWVMTGTLTGFPGF